MRHSGDLAHGAAMSSAASYDSRQAVHGADLLLSLVETHWTNRNGGSGKMESGSRTQQEVERITQQIARLEATPGQDDDTRREIRNLNDRVTALRKQVSSHQ